MLALAACKLQHHALWSKLAAAAAASGGVRGGSRLGEDAAGTVDVLDVPIWTDGLLVEDLGPLGFRCGSMLDLCTSGDNAAPSLRQ